MAISLEAQQPLGHAEIIDGLCNAEQRRYHDHSARATLKERPRALVPERLSANREQSLHHRRDSAIRIMKNLVCSREKQTQTRIHRVEVRSPES